VRQELPYFFPGQAKLTDNKSGLFFRAYKKSGLYTVAKKLNGLALAAHIQRVTQGQPNMYILPLDLDTENKDLHIISFLPQDNFK
jgi:hypothetical protein